MRCDGTGSLASPPDPPIEPDALSNSLESHAPSEPSAAIQESENRMLDVHAPHEAVHTWKDFFIHLATISVGLLVAVGLEQTVESSTIDI